MQATRRHTSGSALLCTSLFFLATHVECNNLGIFYLGVLLNNVFKYTWEKRTTLFRKNVDFLFCFSRGQRWVSQSVNNKGWWAFPFTGLEMFVTIIYTDYLSHFADDFNKNFFYFFSSCIFSLSSSG